MDDIKAAGYDVTTPLIVTNSDDYKDVKILAEDSVTPSDKVLEIVEMSTLTKVLERNVKN